MAKLSRTAVFCLACLPALGNLPSVHAHELIAPKLATEAKISVSDARAQAFKAYQGNIDAVELARAAGGSGLRYTFEMEKGGQHRTVAVDAKTGRVLENLQTAGEHESES
ncbi:MAG: PepSY domain-containing protein [Betaproteobacteria bacterium]|nr:PepSY domain-containing protein [Betaproteobacteria bacterium]